VPYRPGQSGNPAGKPAGAAHKLTLEGRRLAAKEGPAIIKKIADDAKAGEPFAQRLFMQFLYPKSKLVAVPVEREPVASVEEAAKRIAEAFARMESGALDLDEAQAVATMAQAYTSTRNIAELERRSVEMLETIETLKTEIEAMKGRLKP
jgi:hypothetical protein